MYLKKRDFLLPNRSNHICHIFAEAADFHPSLINVGLLNIFSWKISLFSHDNFLDLLLSSFFYLTVMLNEVLL